MAYTTVDLPILTAGRLSYTVLSWQMTINAARKRKKEIGDSKDKTTNEMLLGNYRRLTSTYDKAVSSDSWGPALPHASLMSMSE
ncbi:hypothetical protein BHYA_0106g00180 [Botrytis hyacinthi]|uniref:Uncharacterized protein n=1 Tax=Botrytis hyacinthi TaxID=278943 RepID=A0A4Z1GK65_9HELO|nr:hypothetical protein BHYA_0106g00180 [Botrytis hyacinthi]